MVVNGTFLHNKDEQDRIAKTMKEILVTDEATGERKLKPGVGLDRALTVVEALSEELMRPLKKEAAKLEPGNSPAEPYGDAPFLAPGRLVPPVGVC